MALSFNDLNTDTTVDESSGLQNLTATPAPAGDADDNDTNNALPADYSSRLTVLFGAWTSLDTALSGYDGSPADTGDNVFTINDDGFGVTNLGFSADMLGTPFPPLDLATYDPTDPAKLATYVDSGIDAVDGGNVYMFIDPTNDNLVFGIDEDSDLVFSIYLEEAPDLLSGKIWTTQHEAIDHPDDTNPDDFVNLADKLFVTASRDLAFSLENAPAGQNLGIMFGDGNITDGINEIAIVVTGWNPPNESEGESFTEAAFDSVNTRSGTSFGSNNQGVSEGQGLRFTFVRGPNANFTVPNLDQNEADEESSFDFLDFFAGKGATFLVEQVVSGKTASLTLSLELENAAAASASGDLFVDELLTNNTDVAVNSLTITGLRGANPHSLTQYSATFTGDGSDADLGITVDFLPDGSVKIDGLQQGDSVGYLADFHNRCNIFNSGDGTGNDSGVVDIGSFQLLQADSVSLEVGSHVNYEDDAPGGLGSNAPVTLYEDSLTTATNPTNGNPDAAPPSQPITVQVNISSLVNGGTDGLQNFALDDTYISDLTSLNLKSGNVALVYEIAAGTVGTSGGDVAGDVLTAYIGSTAGDVAFTVGITPDGDVEFKLLHAVDHELVPPATTSDTDLIQTNIGRLFVALDNDDDPFRFAATDVQLNMQDDAPVVDVTDGGTEPGVKYTFDGDQTGGNFQGDEGPTGMLPWNDEARDGLDKSVTTDFSGAFAFAVSPSVGADGGSVTTGYTLDLNVATGSAVQFSGGALTSGGTAVDWYEVTADQVYAGVLTGTTTEVFRISVNTTTGDVTFEQKAKFDHTADVSSAPYTTDVLVLDDGQIDVVKTVTVADGDGGTTYEGDTATDSASVDLGGNFGVGDDGPTADVTLTGTDLGVKYLFDGNTTISGNFEGNNGTALPTGDVARDGAPTSTTLAFAAAFSTAHTNGADGSGGVSTSYAIVFDTGVSAGSDVIMSGSATAVQSGGVNLVWAAVTDGYAAVTDDLAATEIFRLTIDTGTGVVTFAQSGVIDHLVDVGTGPYTTDVRTLAADQLLVQRTDVVTDGESGDTATDSESVDMGGRFGIGDDGPQVAFENLTGTTLTTDPQIGDWTNSVGADVTGSVTVSLDSFSFRRGIDGTLDTGTIDSFAFNAGTGLWEGTVSGDFDNDAGTADTSIDITLELKGDGTYEFAVTETFSAPTVLSTADGELKPGGPDAVQTLLIPEPPEPTQLEVVFTGIDLSGQKPDGAGPFTPPTIADIIADIVVVGETDPTEEELQAVAGLYSNNGDFGNDTVPYINKNMLPNVSQTSIGNNNNQQDGDGIAGITPDDESIVVNPDELVQSIDVFIGNQVGGYDQPSEELYYQAIYEDGTYSTQTLVLSGDLSPVAGSNQKVFTIDAVDEDNLIDAIWLTMAFGSIKIDHMEFTTAETFSADDLFFNFTGNQLDFEGDSASSSWSVDLYGQNADDSVNMADTAVVNGGADNQADDFNIDLTAASTQYTVAGFESGVDELNLLNSVGLATITTGLDLGLGGAGSDDSRVQIDGVTIDLADVTLLGTDVFLFT